MPQRSWIELPSGRFSYLEHGTGEPVVFLHALGREAADWTGVVEALGDRWRCIALDQRGHGRSPRTGRYSFEAMADDLGHFVDALGLDRFRLVAHSLGGTVGWIYARRAPERIHRLVLEDTAPPSGRHRYPTVPETPPEPVDYDWAARRQLFRELNAPDEAWSEDPSSVAVRTLVVCGRRDSGELGDLAAALPLGALVTIEAGHWIHETAPDAFVDTVRRFLRRRVTARSGFASSRGAAMPSTVASVHDVASGTPVDAGDAP